MSNPEDFPITKGELLVSITIASKALQDLRSFLSQHTGKEVIEVEELQSLVEHIVGRSGLDMHSESLAMDSARLQQWVNCN